MKLRLASILIISLILCSSTTAESATRVKDIAFVQGARSNQLVGYGLVAGLEGTGDGRRIPFTRQTLGNMVNQFGITFDITQLRSQDVAAVMVIAELPAYAKEGARIDALVSAVGDAKSLRGGTLLLTPLKAGDNKIYAVAEGPVSIGGFETRANRGAQQRHQAAGIVVQGAIVENEVPSTIISDGKFVSLYLRRADFTTAARLADAVNLRFHEILAEAVDGGTIRVKIPSKYADDKITFISEVELTPVEPDVRAKVVINERTGTVVVGKDAVITPVAISHGDLRIIIGSPKEQAAKTPGTPSVEGHVAQIQGANVGEIANALNSMGILPQDMIAIFEALEQAGALQAGLEFM